MEVLFLIIGLAVGAAAVFAIYSSKTKAADDTANALFAEKTQSYEGQLNTLKQEALLLKEELANERKKSEQLNMQLAATGNENENLNKKLNEQKQELESLQQRFTKEFENLANKILSENSLKFTEQNKQNMQFILNPLGEKIKDFEKRIHDTHLEQEKERSALREQLRNLSDLNKRMSEDAINLTKALKGDAKKQGNWGEVILERVLEKSGLVKGREYFVQQSFTLEDGSRLQPDVVIHLPENKNLVVDSKVSLVAYERYMSADEGNKELSDKFLQEHIASIRVHVKGLSQKSYQNLYEINSPDFVLLFVPIEPAFTLAVSSDENLYDDAFEKNIILVTTTTLLATLRTISSIWKQEYQSRNAMEIAQQGADLYDKFVAFSEDLIKVGLKMDESKKSYSEAMNKLVDGKGNLIRRAENMKKLGLKASKTLPQGLLDRAEE